MMRVTYFYRNGQHGWTESYYNNAATHADALVPAEALRLLRMALAPPAVRVEAFRVSNVNPTRDALIQRISFSLQPGTFTAGSGGINDHTAHPDLAILVHELAQNLQYNSLFLRGLPFGLVRDGVIDTTLAVGWREKFDDYVAELRRPAAGWHILVKVGQPNLTAFTPIADAKLIRATRRKVGRPFDLPHGRRRVSRRQLIRAVRAAITSGRVTHAELAPPPPGGL